MGKISRNFLYIFFFKKNIKLPHSPETISNYFTFLHYEKIVFPAYDMLRIFFFLSFNTKLHTQDTTIIEYDNYVLSV